MNWKISFSTILYGTNIFKFFIQYSRIINTTIFYLLLEIFYIRYKNYILDKIVLFWIKKGNNMTSKTINIKVPAEISEEKVKNRIAADLFKEGEITLKQAADLAEISLWDFLHQLGKMNISFTKISFEDLKHEIEDLT